MSDVIEYLNHLSNWQILLMSSLLLIQGMVVAVFPEEAILLGLGAFWAEGRIEFWQALLAAQLGLLPANLGLVFIGKHFGTRAFRVPPFKWLRRDAVDRALDRIKQKSLMTIIITRFTPLIRGPVYFAVGLSGFSVSKFLRIDALASIVQISALLVAGRLLV